MDITTRIRDLFANIDAMDTDKFVGFLTDDVTFIFGNAPAVEGRDNTHAAVEGFFGTIKGLQHSISAIWQVQDDTVIAQGTATYTRHDGSTITLPFVNVFGMQGEAIRHYQIYIDINPLYAPPEATY